MTRHEIATLACKVIALWLFMQVAIDASSVITSLIFFYKFISDRSGNGIELSSATLYAIPIFAQAILGYILWRSAPAIASRMVSDNPAVVTNANLNQESILAIAFPVVGVATILPALRRIASSFLTIVRGDDRFGHYWNSSTWQAEFWASILVVCLSIWLIFGSRGVARMIQRMRRPGFETVDTSPDA